MEYTVLILILPLLTFLALGLLGTKLKPTTAGEHRNVVFGDMCLAGLHDGMAIFLDAPGRRRRLPVIPFNFEWLRFTQYLHIDLGILLDPISVMMLVVITTVSLMVHVYSLGYMHGGKRFPALLRLPFPFQFLDAGSRGSHEHLPDVHFLGAGGCFLLPVDRFLLHETGRLSPRPRKRLSSPGSPTSVS